MNENGSNNTIALMGIVFGMVLILIGVMSFSNFSQHANQSKSVALSATAHNSMTITQQLEQELVQELLQLRAITLDGSIFDDPVYTSLVDFSRVIKDQPRGRANQYALLTDSEINAVRRAANLAILPEPEPEAIT